MDGNEKRDGGRFMPGTSGHRAGRPVGSRSGRAEALRALDSVLGEEENIGLLKKALEDALRKKPLWFFINIVMPLLPKEARGVLESGDRIVEWRGLLSVGGSAALGTGTAASPSTCSGGTAAQGG